MAVGTVKFFNYDRGYGFISNEGGGADVFVHSTAVTASGLPGLNKGTRLSYELDTGSDGKVSATNLAAA